MKKLKKLSLHSFSKAEVEKQKLSNVTGGAGYCICAGGCNCSCSCPGWGEDSDFYGDQSGLRLANQTGLSSNLADSDEGVDVVAAAEKT